MVLQYCKNIFMVPNSFGCLKKLQSLNLQETCIRSLFELGEELNNFEEMDISSYNLIILQVHCRASKTSRV
jgi:hypothetical protein